MEPTESINPCAASPIFARPSPIALSELTPGIEVGGTALKLARFKFVDVGLVLTPVSELSASDRGTRDSRERRRSVLTDGDGGCSDGIDDEHCCATGLLVSRTMGSSGMSAFSSATDDADDCEKRVPAAEPDVVVIVEEMELEAA